MELQGTIKKINDLETFASGFQKQEVIITTLEQYPQPISVEFMGDKVDLIKYLKEGENYTININIRGREWINPQGEAKYFNSITAWRVEKLDNQQVTTQTAEKPMEVDPFADDDQDDLPF